MSDTNQLVEKFLSVSKHHDWYYQYSDDYSVWSAGNRHYSVISEAFRALQKVDPDLAIDTWNSVAPKDMQYVKQAKE